MKSGLSCADTYIRKLREIADAQQAIIKATEKDLENQKRLLEKSRNEELSLRERVNIANSQVKALQSQIQNDMEYEKTAYGLNEAHRERSKLQDKLEFQIEDWNNELNDQTKKKLEELNAKVEDDNASREILLQLRNVKGQVVELTAMQSEGSKQVEFNKLKEKLIKEVFNDFKDIEKKYKDVKQLRDDTSFDLTTTLERLKGSRQSATFTLKELHQLKEAIEEQKRRLNELAIMAAKYGSSEQVEEEILFWKKKLIEIDE